MVLLAAPGVLISAVVVAVVLNLATGLPFELGMVVGAMVAATDPVAVIATFRNLGVPRRLATLVEGESLFNDATALVLFGATVASIGGEVGIGEAATDLVVTVVVSIGMGLAAGWLAVRLIELSRRARDRADDLGRRGVRHVPARRGLEQSGIIATVVAGVVIGTLRPDVGLSKRALEALDIVWELVAFLLTAIAFLLVGIAISAGDLLAAAPWILWGLVGVVVGRALVVYGLLGGTARLLSRREPGSAVPIGWLHVLFWAGLRGAVAVAMALSLPEDFPQRGAAPADHVRDRPVHAGRAGRVGGLGRVARARASARRGGAGRLPG